MFEIAKNAKIASIKLASLSTDLKNNALFSIAEALNDNKSDILKANELDLSVAEKLLSSGELNFATYNRLKLDENKFRDMVQGVIDVANLQDPVNKTIFTRKLDENLILKKVSCPIGVIGVIFEARPDVISQISALAIKSGNAVILKGGKESINTNRIIFDVINSTLKSFSDFPDNALTQIFTREDVATLLNLDKYVDLIIPRGGNSLVKYIKENTKIPVLGHADGICHIFIDCDADKNMVENICVDAKTQYPSACNSVETILLHENYPFINELFITLKNNGVTIYGDEKSLSYNNEILKASDEDWSCEYGDKIVSVKIIKSVDDAISHINFYGSHHTDCIISNNEYNKELFANNIDSANVYVNASTRFADGFRYGFGAEVGISTNKTHARGPVGLDGLTIYKYKLYGNGQIVHDYVSGNKQFLHIDL